MMKTEETGWWEWKRILIGDAPVEFMIEVIIRAAVMLFMIVILMRFLNRKNVSRPLFETSIIIAIGVIASLPVQSPERGLLPAIVILGCIALFNHLHQLAISRSGPAEKLSAGSVSLIIKDGIIDTKTLKDAAITRDRLFSLLRNRNIRNLGEIRRTYLEPDGALSIIRSGASRPGLSVLPPDDNDPWIAGKTIDYLSCTACGYTRDAQGNEISCPSCGNNEWDHSVNTGNGGK